MALSTYTKSCVAHTPGNTNLILMGSADIDTTTTAISSGVVTDLAVSQAGDAIYIEFDRYGLKTMFEGSSDDSGLKVFTHKIEVHLSKLSSTLRTALANIIDEAVCGLCAVVTDANGSSWVYGLTHSGDTVSTNQIGMGVESANFDSGLRLDEEGVDKVTLTLSGVFSEIPLPVSGTLTANSGLAAATDVIATA